MVSISDDWDDIESHVEHMISSDDDEIKMEFDKGILVKVKILDENGNTIKIITPEYDDELMVGIVIEDENGDALDYVLSYDKDDNFESSTETLRGKTHGI